MVGTRNRAGKPIRTMASAAIQVFPASVGNNTMVLALTAISNIRF